MTSTIVDMDDFEVPENFLKILEGIEPPRFPDQNSPWFPYFSNSFKLAGCGDYWDDCLENTIRNDRQQDAMVPVNGLEIKSGTRYKLLSWMFEVMLQFRLDLSVWMYGVKLLDVYVKKVYIPLKDYQGFGLVCLWIADKYLSAYVQDTESYVELFPGATGVYSEDGKAFFPYAESRIFHETKWSPGIVNTLSYFPDPEFKYDSVYQASVKDFTSFQQCCRWICGLVELDMNLSYGNSSYDLAVCVYMICGQVNPSIKIDLEDNLLMPIWRKILLNQVIDSISVQLSKSEHPYTMHLNTMSTKNIFLSLVLLLFATSYKKVKI